MSVNIAIDGPSGAGKSTLAKVLAKELGYIYVDTGALYRTVALYVIRHGISSKDSAAVIDALKEIKVKFGFSDGAQRVFLCDEDVTDFIRTQEISMAASNVSAIPEVRAFLLSLQRDIAFSDNVIMDGRDIGTVILPAAQVKIFLTASAETRAKRRYDELIAKGIEKDCSYERILDQIRERDTNDMTRANAPLKKADDAVVLDNSDIDFDGTVKAALEIIGRKI